MRAGATVVAGDIGGTHMRAALVRHDGSIVLRESRPTPHHTLVPEALVDLLRSVADRMVSRQEAQAVVGLPGPVDYRSGRLLWAPHLPESWPRQLSEQQLTAELRLPVRLANDADLAAVGEAFFGGGLGYRDVLYLTISTGVGAGLVFGGRLVHGDRSLGEIGHTVIDREAWLVGSPATLEEMASGSALTREAESRGLGSLEGPEIERLAEDGDAWASAAWDRATSAAALGVVNVIMSFSPHVVVIGGGLGRSQRFFERVRDVVGARTRYHFARTEVVSASLGDDAGLIGAARWADATA